MQSISDVSDCSTLIWRRWRILQDIHGESPGSHSQGLDFIPLVVVLTFREKFVVKPLVDLFFSNHCLRPMFEQKTPPRRRHGDVNLFRYGTRKLTAGDRPRSHGQVQSQLQLSRPYPVVRNLEYRHRQHHRLQPARYRRQ